uniref:Putative PIH1 domain containing 2 n=1 Tax=Schistosoma japonicum TaxID=6182 RepID=C1LGH8_SCHJA|nr:putative PIH1 domain containing 2 [Schistosoma japonicum]
MRFMSTNKLLDDANQVWKMLDEMSEKNPEGYRKFISEQMESFCRTLSQPLVRFVVKLTQKSNKQPLLVNFCEWSIIPEPKSSDSPISVKCGDLFKINEVDAITLAFNPKVFSEHNFNEPLKNDRIINEQLVYSQSIHDENRYQLVWLGINCLENEKSLSTIESISVKYSNVPIRPKLLRSSNQYGNKDQVFKSIGYVNKSIGTDIKIMPEIDSIQNLTPETLMKLRNTESTANDDNLCSSPIESLKLPIKQSENNQELNKKTLIEEINDEIATVSQDTTLQKNLNSISWSAQVITSDSTKQSDKKNHLKLIFKLPGIKLGKQCNVDLTMDRVKLEVIDSSVAFHPLDLRLPCKIETNLAEAKFNSKKEKLVILVPILQSS